MIVGGGTGSPGFRQQYDVTADGRLLINVALESAPTPITLVMNWNPAAAKKWRRLAMSPHWSLALIVGSASAHSAGCGLDVEAEALSITRCEGSRWAASYRAGIWVLARAMSWRSWRRCRALTYYPTYMPHIAHQ